MECMNNGGWLSSDWTAVDTVVIGKVEEARAPGGFGLGLSPCTLTSVYS